MVNEGGPKKEESIPSQENLDILRRQIDKFIYGYVDFPQGKLDEYYGKSELPELQNFNKRRAGVWFDGAAQMTSLLREEGLMSEETELGSLLSAERIKKFIDRRKSEEEKEGNDLKKELLRKEREGWEQWLEKGGWDGFEEEILTGKVTLVGFEDALMKRITDMQSVGGKTTDDMVRDGGFIFFALEAALEKVN